MKIHKTKFGTAGQTAIASERGLIALMESGSQLTRDKDADEIVRRFNLFTDLLATLEILTCHAQERHPHFESPRGQADINSALLAIAKAKAQI